ncbi:Bifunctional protein HldE [Anaerohalosphaera lusitana]|uniref:Bifunctional protein HldE n=1 Tax=Anaerohalosphaera lusitana TaxID=1936003 RepID=A0A1U9NLZ4_9BACT|nr:D-glycero-beta-D-manno-heptose 1-phosphate adenylyltransferase [Anaerohalosphaera lusitana]AQT68951.1 Bifunctional protein HldE [Anaerohalosphaera lusitana]
MYKKLIKAVTNLGTPRVLLVGDFILDSYIYGDALRISPEAPVPVLKVVDREHSCGGAASVAADLAVLGAKTTCLGVVGKDSNGKLLKDLLEKQGADPAGLIEATDRPTINKLRMVGLAQHRHRQQLLRVDEENTEPLTRADSQRLLEVFESRLAEADVVCLQDYRKGVLSEQFCRKAIELARKAGKRVLVDPPMDKNYDKFKGASAMTPNRYEASAAVGFDINTIDDAARAAQMLTSKLDLEAVVITLDKEGAYLRSPVHTGHIPTVPRTVYDVTGAGDMVLAMLAASLAGGCDYETAVHLSNIAGGIEVEKFGVATVSIDEIVNEIIANNKHKTGKIHTVESLQKELSFHRHQGESIVFTNGCFDVIHRGHIEYLGFCKQQGDILVVGLNSDRSVRELKGPERPINNQHDRAAVLAGLASVDYITIFDEPDPLALIKQVGPDILVKGEDWAEKGVVGREFVESNGGKVVLAPLVDGKSSTSTINKMKELDGNDRD